MSGYLIHFFFFLFIFVAHAVGTEGCAQIEDSGQGGLHFSEMPSRERDLGSGQDSGHGQLLA